MRLGVYLLAGSLLFTACEQEESLVPVESCSGAPTLTEVTKPTQRSETFQGAELDEWIILKGTNLCNISKITVNDVEVDVKAAHVTASEITFQIPKIIPGEISNKITVSGASGETSMNFNVNVPPLAIVGFGGAVEEFTPAGQTLIIKARNLDLYDFTQENTQVSFGATTVKPTAVTASEIRVAIPANTPENTVVKVSNGTIEREVPLHYKDQRGLIFTADPEKPGWTSIKISNGPNPAPISGNYVVIDGNIGAWDWNEDYHVADMKRLADYGVTPGSVDRYVIKMEVYVPEDWTSNPLRIWYKSQGGTFNYNFPWGGTNYSGATFRTSGWQTVTIPLADFVYSEDDAGSKKGQNVKTLDAADVNELREMRVYVFGGDAKKMRLYWDNLRIVPKY